MGVLKVWDGTAWQFISATSDGDGASVFVGPEAPPGTPDTGDMWFDSDEDGSTGTTLPLTVANGGTGATSATLARSSLAVPGIGNSTTTAGAPTTGTWARGDQWLDSTNVLWICTAAGTPGTWTESPAGVWTSYTPTWTTSGTAPSLGNGTLAGRYMRIGKFCAVALRLTMGSTTGGGNGECLFTLPFPVSASAPTWLPLSGYLYMAGNNTHWPGFAQVNANNSNVVRLHLPTASNSSVSLPLRNADGTNAAGTGTPTVAGVYPLSNGSTVNINGTYEIA